MSGIEPGSATFFPFSNCHFPESKSQNVKKYYKGFERRLNIFQKMASTFGTQIENALA